MDVLRLLSGLYLRHGASKEVVRTGEEEKDMVVVAAISSVESELVSDVEKL